MSLWKDKYVIGLTGNIAVGKSLVRQMLQHLGAYPIDADSLSHQAMLPGAPAYLPTVEMFGKIILDENGHINRATLGTIAFSIPEALLRLEAITHPVINQAITTLISRAKQRVIVIEAIKLLESPALARAVDTVWVVDASPEAQIQRLTSKRKMSVEDARRRLNAQGDQADKLSKANLIIRNDGNPEETWKQVQTAWNDLGKALNLNIRGTESEGIPAVRANAPQTPAAPASSPAASTLPKPPAPAAPAAGLPGAGAVRIPPAAAAASGAPGTPPTNPVRPQAAPAVPSTQPSMQPVPSTVAQPPASPKPIAPPIAVTVRRGKPGETDHIAKFITRVSGKNVDRMDIMLAFGQKSYLLATEQAGLIVGVVGWQVENLITRVDEIYLDTNSPKEPVIGALITAIEEHSKDLQSEVAFIALPAATTSNDVVGAFLKGGYQPLKMEDIKFPAWREAARELLNPEMRPLMKQLRTDRIMKPI